MPVQKCVVIIYAMATKAPQSMARCLYTANGNVVCMEQKGGSSAFVGVHDILGMGIQPVQCAQKMVDSGCGRKQKNETSVVEGFDGSCGSYKFVDF